MNISINPWYYCNFRCEFCYLTHQQLGDKKLLNLDDLETRLIEICSNTNIDQIDLYGGEIGLLPKSYYQEFKSIINKFSYSNLNIITNLSAINDIVLDEESSLSVSYDFDARESSDLVYRNMALLPKEFSILMLASDKLIEKDVDEMIMAFNLLENLVSVEIKPYSTNQANSLNISFNEYEDFVKKWILSGVDKKFEFVNEFLIQDVLDKNRNSFSDDHVYITPNGKFGVLEFDHNDNEYFLEYDTFEEYINWTKQEKLRVSNNGFCSKCEYFGRCLSEHLREVKNLDNSCNGFKHLIDWYKNVR